MRSVAILAFVLTISVSYASNAAPVCPAKASELPAGIYVRQNDTGVSLSAMEQFEQSTRRSVDLFYVIRTIGERAGAVIVKKARFGALLEDDAPPSGQVNLARNSSSTDCPGLRPTYSGRVSIQAYEDYHGHGRESSAALSETSGLGSARDELKAFHTSYRTRNGCRETDSKYGPDGSYIARNNRSQFSFDTNVVDIGMPEPAFDIASRAASRIVSYVITPVGASEAARLRERAVELMPYQTTNGFACVAFTLDGRLPKQMLRVNDLEGPQIEGRPREVRLGPGAKRGVRLP